MLEIKFKTEKLPDLEECFKYYYQQTDIEDFQCPKCFISTKFTKQSMIYWAPKYLIVQLKRFSVTDGHSVEKLIDTVLCPETIDLSPWISDI